MHEPSAAPGQTPAEVSIPLDEETPYRVRHLAPTDVAFVVTHWHRSYEQSAFAKRLGDHYRAVQTRIVHGILARSHAVTLLACDLEDPGILFGFACYEGTTLHYVFVRPDFRGRGIARRLLKHVTIEQTSHPWKDYPVEAARAW